MTAYLLDANALITAHRQWYGFDFCPGFWEWIVAQHAAGRVYSVARVEAELLGADDQLASWARQLPDGFFLRESDTEAAAFANLATWARRQNYQPAAVATFLQSADAALVAQAQARKSTVVTLEVRSGSPRIVKIPDACVGLNVDYLTPYAMLRREKARFILGGPT
ncbi:MAG: DUF4411 family protein [Polyangiaceae bacterium]|nr:DUF4411 family protein [Polyangiaceae bacterium]